ncbi:MAG: hypothetical protein RMJ44_07730 [Cytophagales bacterium]|nr:hypothetical protein [Bernardetiaceae bacterium]MDW8210965.1 hypothetical protein [Cytophagales bacterium]
MKPLAILASITGGLLAFLAQAQDTTSTQSPVFRGSSIDIRRSKQRNTPHQDHVAKVTFGILLGSPVNEFRQVAGDVIPWGYNLNAVFRLNRHVPFFAGLDFGYMGMGRSVDVSTAPTGWTTRIARRNRIITGHLLLRLQPNWDSPILPYFDGMAGVKYFRTATEIETSWGTWWNNNNNSNTRTITVPNHEDLALSYGGGIGLSLTVGKNIWIDVRAVYLPGSVASYVKRGDVYPDPNDPAKTVVVKSRSATDMINYQAGIMLSF